MQASRRSKPPVVRGRGEITRAKINAKDMTHTFPKSSLQVNY